MRPQNGGAILGLSSFPAIVTTKIFRQPGIPTKSFIRYSSGDRSKIWIWTPNFAVPKFGTAQIGADCHRKQLNFNQVRSVGGRGKGSSCPSSKCMIKFDDLVNLSRTKNHDGEWRQFLCRQTNYLSLGYITSKGFGRIRYGSVIQTNRNPPKHQMNSSSPTGGHVYYQPKQWTVEGNLHDLDLPGHGLVYFPYNWGLISSPTNTLKQPGSNPPPTLTFRACNLKGRWITRNSKQNMGKRWGKDEENYEKIYENTHNYGIFCEIILCDYRFSSYLLIISWNLHVSRIFAAEVDRKSVV